jgi:agmatinase
LTPARVPGRSPARAGKVLAAILYLAPLVSLADDPGSPETKLAALTAGQQAFINSGAALDFLPEWQLQHEISVRDPEQLALLIDDLMALAEAMAYDPARDMGAIPLNLNSDRFNRGTLPTPEALRELERAPGPFGVSRYLYPTSGVPTFAGAPVAIWPEDLVAGDVDVAIIGVPSNMSSGRRDSGNGPNAMRSLNTIAQRDGQSLVDPMNVLSVVDYGDFSVDGLSTERTVTRVSAMVAETAATGVIPMLVGGDTSMLYPGVAGVAQVAGAGTFGLLHFSAHPDVVRNDDHQISDRRAVFSLLEDGAINGESTVLVGLRGDDLDLATLQWLRGQQVRYHTMAAIQARGLEQVLQRVQKEVVRGPEQFFVSVDVSVLDPAEMPAAGRLVSQGVRLAEVARLIRFVCAEKTIVGFEITDLAPMLDTSRVSTANANALLNACLNGIAVRQAGLDPDYVHPLTLDHGQR